MKCSCGLSVSSRGLASHLRGNAHACGVERERLYREDWIRLAGTTRGTVTALRARGFRVAELPYWAPGSKGCRGHKSAEAAVRREDLQRLCAGDGPALAVTAARRIKRIEWFEVARCETPGEAIERCRTQGPDAAAVMADLLREVGAIQ